MGVLESIVNSIQSIEEASIKDGYVHIYAQRLNAEQLKWDMMNDQSTNEQLKPEVTAFESFTVTDNGIGFTSDNYKSFCTADSSLKWGKGCKGIGRFLWLKAFDKASIESTFQEDNIWYKRTFDFTLEGVTPDENLVVFNSQERITTVSLSGFKNPYRDKCPRSLEIIARKIIEHYLIYFLLGKCPKIILSDNLEESINLSQYYDDKIRDSLHQDHFSIDEQLFVIYHIKMPEGATAHELHLCANDREVRSILLSKFFPQFAGQILHQCVF